MLDGVNADDLHDGDTVGLTRPATALLTVGNTLTRRQLIPRATKPGPANLSPTGGRDPAKSYFQIGVDFDRVGVS